MLLAIGDKLCRYETLTPIGKDGMEEPDKASDTRPDRVVAIKVSKTDGTSFSLLVRDSLQPLWFRTR